MTNFEIKTLLLIINIIIAQPDMIFTSQWWSALFKIFVSLLRETELLSKYVNSWCFRNTIKRHFSWPSMVWIAWGKHWYACLTHWTLGDLKAILGKQFSNYFSDWWLRYLLWNCSQMNITEPHWWWINIGSDNGLVPSGNKPIHEPMLTQVFIALWYHQATVSYHT